MVLWYLIQELRELIYYTVIDAKKISLAIIKLNILNVLVGSIFLYNRELQILT